jgi:hypothetical protein
MHLPWDAMISGLNDTNKQENRVDTAKAWCREARACFEETTYSGTP